MNPYCGYVGRQQREQQYMQRRLKDFDEALQHEAEMAQMAKKDYQVKHLTIKMTKIVIYKCPAKLCEYSCALTSATIRSSLRRN